jgi:predicted nucleic acid-binding protein
MSASSGPSVLSGSPIFVVDSWPVLEYVYGHEPAYTLFLERLEAAQRLEIRLCISRINYGEIVYNFQGKRRRGEIPADINLDISEFPWEVISVDDALVDEAAELKSLYAVSYADCVAAALARRYNAPVMTGDPDFLKLQSAGVLSVDWLGK